VKHSIRELSDSLLLKPQLTKSIVKLSLYPIPLTSTHDVHQEVFKINGGAMDCPMPGVCAWIAYGDRVGAQTMADHAVKH
jgi:hypothetical protein